MYREPAGGIPLPLPTADTVINLLDIGDLLCLLRVGRDGRQQDESKCAGEYLHDHSPVAKGAAGLPGADDDALIAFWTA